MSEGDPFLDWKEFFWLGRPWMVVDTSMAEFEISGFTENVIPKSDRVAAILDLNNVSCEKD